MATEAAIDTPVASSSAPAPAKRRVRSNLTASVILNRSPIITREPTPFETAYYDYQARIRRALHNPFPYEFYFKQGSLLEARFNIEETQRERNSFGDEFVGQSGSTEVKEEDKKAAEQLSQQEGEGEVIMPREHPADVSGDVKSLDRAAERNLYLLVRAKQDGKDIWRFPQGGVEKGELLHQAAQRDLFAECGAHMDAWIVGRKPVGVLKSQSNSTPSEGDEKFTFFFKGHIMAGQVRPQEKTISDFCWLTKQEIQPRVDDHYWQNVKDMLSDH
ncbi:hypothetical protein HGRIS_013431 [Hohenbuehelia grisea]|uniref:Large ribosomal subunit protein mL46 n=1 Tax=Hohenbuehelia grisea TaxID=104357 RepID=A0ABR3IVM3_9AGAR